MDRNEFIYECRKFREILHIVSYNGVLDQLPGEMSDGYDQINQMCDCIEEISKLKLEDRENVSH